MKALDILKDADATAIYGSRAANGAILITTKKGKAGKNTFDINIQHGWGQVTRRPKLMNTQEYLEMRHEAFYNDSVYDPLNFSPLMNLMHQISCFGIHLEYADWQKKFIGGTASFTNVFCGF